MSSESEPTETRNEEPKTTRITFHNPETKSLPAVYGDDEEKARDHFESVQYIRERIGPERIRLFGEFAVAVRELEVNGNVDALLTLWNRLADRELKLQFKPSAKETRDHRDR